MYLLLILLAVVSYGIQWRLRSKFKQYAEVHLLNNLSGREVAARMLAATADARDAALGHEAVVVSHQLPVWMARCAFEGRRFAHDPRKRQCALASVTSVTYDGDRFAGVTYAESAGATPSDAVPGA